MLRRLILTLLLSSIASTSTASKLELRGVVLLQPEQVIGARVSGAAELADYLQALERAASAYFATLEPSAPRAGHLVVATKPGDATNAWVVLKPTLSESETQALVRRLREVKPIATKDGPIVFALTVSIDGALASNDPPIVEEWSKAAQKAGQALSVDEAVLQTWKD